MDLHVKKQRVKHFMLFSSLRMNWYEYVSLQILTIETLY